MKKIFTILLVAFSMMAQAQSDLIITGVVDGSLPGGKPKVIELYATADIADLSVYGIGAANNGGGTDGIEMTLSGSINAGEFYYLAKDSTSFHAFFGFYPSALGGYAVGINGDDAVELFKDSVVVDVFGDINVDGTGQPWEYKDSWAYRVNGTGPDGTNFVVNHWTYGGVDALDNQTTNATATTPFPIGTYSPAQAANPTVAFGSSAMTVSETAGTITIPVSITAANANPTTVTISIDTTSTATSADYTLNTTTVTFPANSTDPQNVSITITDDMLEEGDETIVLTLSNPTNNATIGTNASTTITITDNDTTVPGKISFIDPNPYENNLTPENAGTLTFQVKLANGNNMPASVNITVDTTMTTATEGADFTISPTMLTFPANVSADTMTFTVNITDDTEVEMIEKIVLQLTSPSNATLGDSTMVIEIADNDATPDSIVVNEIMYNNPGSDSLEFIEIHNYGTTDVNLSGARVQQAVWYTFPEGTTLAAGGYIVIADKPAAIQNNFGITAAEWGGSLNNSGETIKLYDASGILVSEVAYEDQAPWPTVADGQGPSLELCDPTADSSNPTNWHASTTSTNVVINNVVIMATPGAMNSSCAAPSNPVIAFNATTMTFSEADGTVSIPVTIIAANANATTVEIEVDTTSTATSADYTLGTTSVTFPANSTDTQNVMITLADNTVEDGVKTIVLKLTNPTNMATLGDSIVTITIIDNDATAPNLVITELLYNNPGVDSLEFIEIYNNGTSAVDMNGFQFTDGITHTFTTSTVVNAGEYFVIAKNAAAFNNVFNMNVPQWTSGGLKNSGERLELKDAAGNVVDSLTYDDKAPWPVEADGNGPSLELCDVNADNNDAANWHASTNIIVNGTDTIMATPRAANSPCVTETTPVITFETDSTTVNEDIGTIEVAVIITDGNSMPTTVTMNIDSTSTAQAADYTVEVNEVTFAGGTSTDTMNFKIKIENDNVDEAVETIVLTFSANNNATNGAIAKHIVTINPSDDVATRDIFAGQVKVFPNPATDVIRLETALQVDKVRLLNVLGQEVATRNKVTETSFDVSELAEGMYFLEVTSSNKTGTFQVIVK